MGGVDLGRANPEVEVEEGARDSVEEDGLHELLRGIVIVEPEEQGVEEGSFERFVHYGISVEEDGPPLERWVGDVVGQQEQDYCQRVNDLCPIRIVVPVALLGVLRHLENVIFDCDVGDYYGQGPAQLN